MTEQMTNVFEDGTHELHKKSGLFHFFIHKKKCSLTTKRLPAVIILSSIYADGTK